jgi:hypothetical protein
VQQFGNLGLERLGDGGGIGGRHIKARLMSATSQKTRI